MQICLFFGSRKLCYEFSHKMLGLKYMLMLFLAVITEFDMRAKKWILLPNLYFWHKILPFMKYMTGTKNLGLSLYFVAFIFVQIITCFL